MNACWKVQVLIRGKVCAEFEVSDHRFPRNNLCSMMKAIFLKYKTRFPEEMVEFYCTNHRGTLIRSCLADPVQKWDLKSGIEYWEIRSGSDVVVAVRPIQKVDVVRRTMGVQ